MIELDPAVGQHCAKDGLVILSGLLAVQAESLVAAYNAAVLTLIEREDIGEWSALLLKRK